ncbi:MAG TPA: DUF2339 domain-containing protein, partial [Gammaproteobacteria bacterium]|nr:DUF2339 domain-containing protein [Gammaproteobacteria bacterium]
MLPFIATLLAIIPVAVLIDLEAGLLLGLIVALVSSQWVAGNRFKGLQRRIDGLDERLAGLENRSSTQSADSTPAAETRAQPESVSEAAPPVVRSPPTATSSPEAMWNTPRPAARAAENPPPTRGRNPADRLEEFIRLVAGRVVSYFTDGNIFVRVGILILFFGVAFLLKYAAENSRIPLEIRFMGAAFGGVLLLVTGW